MYLVWTHQEQEDCRARQRMYRPSRRLDGLPREHGYAIREGRQGGSVQQFYERAAPVANWISAKNILDDKQIEMVRSRVAAREEELNTVIGSDVASSF